MDTSERAGREQGGDVCCELLPRTNPWPPTSEFSAVLGHTWSYRCPCSPLKSCSAAFSFLTKLRGQTRLGLSRWLSGKESACQAGGTGSIPGLEDPLEKGMATPSSILAWRIPSTEEPGRLQSMGSQRVGHNWVTEYTHTLKLDSIDRLYIFIFMLIVYVDQDHLKCCLLQRVCLYTCHPFGESRSKNYEKLNSVCNSWVFILMLSF